MLSPRVTHDALPWIILLLLPVILGAALRLWGEDGPDNSEPDPEPRPEPEPERKPGDGVALAA